MDAPSRNRDDYEVICIVDKAASDCKYDSPQGSHRLQASVLPTKCFNHAFEHLRYMYGCQWASVSAMGNCNPFRADHE
eukprot:15840400-Heterocapsa_arctica.AAC.1